MPFVCQHLIIGVPILFLGILEMSMTIEIKKTEKELIDQITDLKLKIEKQELELKTKKYGLVWDSEKEPEQVVLDCENNIPILKREKRKEIKTDDSDDNILIEGDNYHALSCLNYTHKGKIDVIYIDPPYNTGKANEWKYNDKYVDENDGYKHSKWLNFMEKRLRLAKNLLKEDGVIFISIDDNELHQLKLLSDTFFKENNFELMIWDKVTGNTNAGSGKMKITYRFRKDHEYIVCIYLEKNKVKFTKPLGLKKVKNEYGNIDNDPRGNWMSCEICKSEVKSIIGGKNYFTFKTPFGKEITRQWHYSKDELNDLIKDNRIFFGNGNIIPRLKKFLEEESEITPTSIIQNLASTTDGNNEAKELNFDFENPKPSKLIKYLLGLVVDNKKDAIILDFFAGSGTTGHAVLELNKEDGGNRKFILCTNNEVGSKDEQSFRKKYNISEKDGIFWQNKKKKEWLEWCEKYGICSAVTYPRIEKVIKGYKLVGKNKEILFEKKLTFNQLKNVDEILKEIDEILKEKEKKFDEIEESFDNNIIKIIGIKNINSKKDGLRGNLQYFKTDLIPVERINIVNDKQRYELTEKAGQMIAIKENTFEEIEVNEWYQISENKDKSRKTAIYFREDMDEFETLVKKLKKTQTTLYVFSYGRIDKKLFKYLDKNIVIEDIPEPIIEIYKEINLTIKEK